MRSRSCVSELLREERFSVTLGNLNAALGTAF